MMRVAVASALSCGCTEALVDDDGRLVAATANVCKPAWWCECQDNRSQPAVCDHAVVLMLLLEEQGWRS